MLREPFEESNGESATRQKREILFSQPNLGLRGPLSYLRRPTMNNPNNPMAASATVEGSGVSMWRVNNTPVKSPTVARLGEGMSPPPKPIKWMILWPPIAAEEKPDPVVLSHARMMIQPEPPGLVPGISVIPKKNKPSAARPPDRITFPLKSRISTEPCSARSGPSGLDMKALVVPPGGVKSLFKFTVPNWANALSPAVQLTKVARILFMEIGGLTDCLELIQPRTQAKPALITGPGSGQRDWFEHVLSNATFFKPVSSREHQSGV